MMRFAAVAAVVALLGVGSAAGHAVRATVDGKIVFQGTSRARTALYVVNPDGSGFHKISAAGVFSGEPSWSPDGTRIAFSSSRSGEGTLSIYVADATGGNGHRLTFDPDDDHDPAWSPNGRQIAYAGTGVNLMAEDGSIVRRITAELPLRSPTWSPNGRSIAFASGPNARLSTTEIYSVRTTGAALKQLTSRGRGAVQPAWSPDGRRIAFVTGSDLYVMNPDGSGQRRLTFTAAPESSPAWSPDGRLIVFARGKGRMSLYVIPSAGGRAKLLVSAPGISLDAPSWQRR